MKIKQIHEHILNKTLFDTTRRLPHLVECYGATLGNIYQVDVSVIGPAILIYDTVADVWVKLNLDDRIWGSELVYRVDRLIPKGIQDKAIALSMDDMLRVQEARSITGLL